VYRYLTCSTGPFFCQSPRDPCNFLSRKPRRGFNAPLSQSALPASSPPLVQRRTYYSQSTPTILTMHRGSHSSSDDKNDQQTPRVREQLS
jgi:hypothetical protein